MQSKVRLEVELFDPLQNILITIPVPYIITVASCNLHYRTSGAQYIVCSVLYVGCRAGIRGDIELLTV